MPAKKPTQPAAIDGGRALEHGANAYGAKFIRRGFAATPALDLAYACGRGSTAMGPLALKADLAGGKLAKPKWPDAIAHRNVALFVLRTSTPIWMLKEPVPAGPGAPMTADEARDILAARWGAGFFEPMMSRAIEALVGSSVVLGAIVDRIEALPQSAWANNVLAAPLMFLHGLLLRVPAAEHTAARTRLAAVHARYPEMHAMANLAISLRGIPGVVARGYKYIKVYNSYGSDVSWPGYADAPVSHDNLELLDGEAAYVAGENRRLWEIFGWKMKALMMSPANARVTFLGGAPLIADDARAVPGMTRKGHAEKFAACEEFRGKEVTAMMTALAAQPAIAGEARAWLEANA